MEEYLAGPAALRTVVQDMTHEQLIARPVAGKWSTLEVVCHLVDSEQAWCHSPNSLRLGDARYPTPSHPPVVGKIRAASSARSGDPIGTHANGPCGDIRWHAAEVL